MNDRRDVIPDTEIDAPGWAWAELESGSGAPPSVARTRAETEQLHRDEVEEAYRRGVADGQDSGAKRTRAELQSVMSATLEALEEIRSNRVEWAARLQEDVTLLAGAMARQIVDRALEEDPEIFSELARKAVACFPADEPVRIRLHPADLEQLQQSGTADQFTESRSVRWVPDEDVVRGGCIVEGPDKVVDGRVDEGIVRLIRMMNSG